MKITKANASTKQQDLADLITRFIKGNFEEIHLSQNLMDTIKMDKSGDTITIEIPAEIYDTDVFLEKGVIIYTGAGSYANEVNKSGGWSGAHVGYVENSIKNAIALWLEQNNIKGKVNINE